MTDEINDEEITLLKRQREIDEDYELTRDTLRELLEANKRMIPILETVCKGSESPRAFEVLSKLNKDTADISAQLLEMQRNKQVVDTESAMDLMRIREEGKNLPLLTATVVEDKKGGYVGTAADLQKKLAKRLKEKKEAEEVEVDAQS